MDIAENIYLNAWPEKCGLIDENVMYQKAQTLCQELGISANLHTKTKHLGIGVQQMVEIAKALAKDVQILVLDEPTASLTEKEVDVLMDFLDHLRQRGVTCIYISHKLEEVFRISDRISVLRDGQLVSTYETADVTEWDVIRAMVGRELEDRFPYHSHEIGEPVLQVRDLSLTDAKGKKILKNISFDLCRGEILGISGLMGAGRTEMAMTIFGAMEGRENRHGHALWRKGRYPTLRRTRSRAALRLSPRTARRKGLLLCADGQRQHCPCQPPKAVSHGRC